MITDRHVQRMPQFMSMIMCLHAVWATEVWALDKIACLSVVLSTRCDTCQDTPRDVASSFPGQAADAEAHQGSPVSIL
jgi:hypothetical protein